MNLSPPSIRFAGLFAAVQERELFADCKTFADAIPRLADTAIRKAYAAARPMDDAALRSFVATHFAITPESAAEAPKGTDIDRHIADSWHLLTRNAAANGETGSLIPLPERYVVPGGRFRELYYWDSFFTMLGLARSGRQDLIDAGIANFGHLIETFGHIPNGNRTYYLSRSQPPMLHLMVALAGEQSRAARARRLKWLRAEHAFWMAGADDLRPGESHRRVARLPDGTLLNRYWDDRPAPRDESWREDVQLAQASAQPAEELWRNIRAGAESGWDFSSRWLGDPGDLSTIRTTRLLPIDLNCLLYGLETAIAREAAALGSSDAAQFVRCAEKRAEAIERHFWHHEGGYYADFDLDTGRTAKRLTAATAFPLFAGIAADARASCAADALAALLSSGGLLTTAERSGQQWDAPNGWAPLQWIAVSGLNAYGHAALARTIAGRWTGMVADTFARSGELLEKYDVVACRGGGGGEYGNEVGFGWTNGVYLALASDGVIRGDLLGRAAAGLPATPIQTQAYLPGEMR